MPGWCRNQQSEYRGRAYILDRAKKSGESGTDRTNAKRYRAMPRGPVWVAGTATARIGGRQRRHAGRRSFERRSFQRRSLRRWLLRYQEISDDLQPFGNFLRIAPEGVVDETVEQVRRQQARARVGLDRAAHGVQPRSAGPFVEFPDVVVDVVEIVLESRLVDEGVDGVHRLGRVGGQGFVLDQQQAIPLRAVARLFECVVGSTDHAIGCRHTVGAGIDRAARAVVENRRRAEDGALDQALDAVED